MKVIILASSFLILIFSNTSCVSTKKDSNSKVELISTTFPDDPLFELSGQKATIKNFTNNKKSSLLILVNPSCEDCIKKMDFIRNNLKKYKNQNIILVANKDRVDAFKELLENNKLSANSSLQFALATEELSVSLRAPTVPSLYMYKKGEGVYYFEHGTSIDSAFTHF